MTETDDSTQLPGVSRVPIHEFLVDFLGGLVPGILFTSAAFIAVVPPTWAVLQRLSDHSPDLGFAAAVLQLLDATQGTPSMIWIGALGFATLISYILGHLFYRRDPKEPNRRSFATVSTSEAARKELDKLESDKKKRAWLRQNFACADKDECEFPFPYLADYLEKRGHEHLRDLVTWGKEEDKAKRSKTYVNMLKIRIQFHFPEKYRRIVRNEAHVRLATSTWYVGKALRMLASFWLLLTGVAIIATELTAISGSAVAVQPLVVWYVPHLLPPAFVAVFGAYAKFACERFIHYQRLREVFYVLELAYTAFRDAPELLKSPRVFYEFPKEKEPVLGV